MIIEINGKRTRRIDFQTYKIIGMDKYELHYYKKGQKPIVWPVNIFLEYGGELAGTIGDVWGNDTPIKRYEISFNKLPDNIKKQVIECIKYMEKNGTPMENDESVFSY